MGTDEQVVKVVIILAVRTLLSMIIVVIVDKLSSLRASIEPSVDEFGPIDSPIRQSTSRDHFEGVPGNVALMLATLVILG